MTGLLAELLEVGGMLEIVPVLICTASKAAEYKLPYVHMYVHAVTNDCITQLIVMSFHEPCSEYLSMVLVSILYI